MYKSLNVYVHVHVPVSTYMLETVHHYWHYFPLAYESPNMYLHDIKPFFYTTVIKDITKLNTVGLLQCMT